MVRCEVSVSRVRGGGDESEDVIKIRWFMSAQSGITRTIRLLLGVSRKFRKLGCCNSFGRTSKWREIDHFPPTFTLSLHKERLGRKARLEGWKPRMNSILHNLSLPKLVAPPRFRFHYAFSSASMPLLLPASGSYT